jgi:RNase P subunit RPR2
MVLKGDQQRVKTLLAETITLLCKSGLRFSSELRVEALIGITIDQNEVFLVSLNETMHPGSTRISGAAAAKSQLQKVKSLVQKVSTDGQATSLNDVDENEPEDSTEQSGTGVHSSVKQNTRHRHTAKDSSGPCVNDSGSDLTASAGSVKANKLSSKKRRRPSQTLDACQLSGSDGDVARNLLPVKHEEFDAEVMESCDESTFLAELHDNDSAASPQFAVLADDSFQKQVDADDAGETTGTLIMTVDGSATAVFASSRQRTSGNASRGGSQQRVVTASRTTAISLDSRDNQPTRSKNVECPDCGKVLNTPGSLRVHQTTVHRRSYQLVCALCGKGFRSEYFLRGHMASRHNMRKEFLCQICSKEFSYKHTLKEHMLNLHPTEAADAFPF